MTESAEVIRAISALYEKGQISKVKDSGVNKGENVNEAGKLQEDN